MASLRSLDASFGPKCARFKMGRRLLEEIRAIQPKQTGCSLAQSATREFSGFVASTMAGQDPPYVALVGRVLTRLTRVTPPS